MTDHIIVTGVPKDTPFNPDKVCSRLPIKQVRQDEKQWSLYIQATQAMMHDASKHPLSWFQVSGIHGLPQVEWEHAPGLANPEWPGYCTHSSNVFPTWHRAYMLLFEQALVAAAIDIANGPDYTSAPDAADWAKAAKTLRAPYWDWAVDEKPLAEVIDLITFRTITVVVPKTKENLDGALVLDPNPLLSFHFKPEDADSIKFLTLSTDKTTRHPRAKPEDSLESLNADLKSLFTKRFGGPIALAVSDTLFKTRSWFDFSNDLANKDHHSFYNSLEYIHDSVHLAVGGTALDWDTGELSGDMTWLERAGFDPIFWLHHCNCDRLLSFWQTLHPSTWVTPYPEHDPGNFFISTNTMVKEDTALEPFWNGSTTFWKSTGLTNWQALNYTYPEYAAIPAGDDVQAAIKETIKKLYGTTQPTPGPKHAMKTSDNQPILDKLTTFAGRGSSEQSHFAAATEEAPPDALEWALRIALLAGKADMPFEILFFIGPPPDSKSDWKTDANYIGSYSAFINTRQETCAQCVQRIQSGMSTEGFVRLTHTLHAKEKYGSSHEEIVDFLVKNLEWRIVRGDGHTVDFTDAEGLTFQILTKSVRYSREDGIWYPVDDAAPTIAHTINGGSATD